MSVSAIIVTRGNVDLGPVLASLPREWETIIWNNGEGDVIFNGYSVTTHDSSGEVKLDGQRFARLPDLSVYGRYEAINYASHETIYVQDDDAIVNDPAAIVRGWENSRSACAKDDWDPRYLWHASPEEIRAVGRGEHVCCNMPEKFRHDFYREHALVGFGAAFNRHAPARAFGQFWRTLRKSQPTAEPDDDFYRTCDVVFTALTPRVLVDVQKDDLPWAEDDDRMWKRKEHYGERLAMLKLALEVKRVA